MSDQMQTLSAAQAMHLLQIQAPPVWLFGCITLLRFLIPGCALRVGE